MSGSEGGELVELQQELEALQAEGHRIGALPYPWPDDPPPHATPEAVQRALEQARAEGAERFEGWETEVDCSEYPCLVVYDGVGADLQDVPSPKFRYGYGAFMSSTPWGQREIHYPLPEGGKMPKALERRLEARRDELMSLEAP